VHDVPVVCSERPLNLGIPRDIRCARLKRVPLWILCRAPERNADTLVEHGDGNQATSLMREPKSPSANRMLLEPSKLRCQRHCRASIDTEARDIPRFNRGLHADLL
jgi:hypothetical protein